MPPTRPSHLHSRRAAAIARSCRLTALEIRLALAAGGWAGEEGGWEEGGGGGVAQAQLVQVAGDGATPPSTTAQATTAPRAYCPAPEDVERGPAAAVEVWPAPLAAAGARAEAATTTTTPPGGCVFGGRRPGPVATAATTTAPLPHHHIPWHAEGREASWRARLQAAAVAAGGGVSRAPLLGVRVGEATGTTTAPTPAWPSLSYRAGTCSTEAGTTTRVPSPLPGRSATDATTTTTATTTAPHHPPLFTVAPTPADPSLRAGFDLAIQVLSEERAARWG